VSTALCGGCGLALAGSLFCPRCGTAAAPRRAAPAVPPLPLIGTIGTIGTASAAAAITVSTPCPRIAASRSAKERSPHGLALVVDAGPLVLLLAVAGWGWWRAALSAPIVLGFAGAAVLYLLVWAGLMVGGTSIGRACTATSRRAIDLRHRQAGQVPAVRAADPRPAVPAIPRAVSSVPEKHPYELRPVTSPVLLDPRFDHPRTVRPTPAAPGRPSPVSPAPWTDWMNAVGGRVVDASVSTVTTPVATWSVTLDDGRVFPLRGPSLIGRDPARLPGEIEADVLAVPDETRTVSKTHVRLDPGSDAVLVTDRHSTNGVVVITAGVATRCRAGEPMVAGPGSVVRFGDREMQVHKE
jgi:hypothetical protein